MSSPSSIHLLRKFIATSTRCARECPLYTLSLTQARYKSHPRFFLPHRPRVAERTFVSTPTLRAALAQRPPALRTELVSHPSSIKRPREEEDEDEDDSEVELVPPDEAVLQMTDRAAEQLCSIARRENNSNAALRVSVESGGCHGYQYKMVLAKHRRPDDYHFSHPRIKPSNLYVDVVSMSLLKGSTVDFATELIGSSFRITDNPQAKNSGCGCGVSWELRL